MSMITAMFGPIEGVKFIALTTLLDLRSQNNWIILPRFCVTNGLAYQLISKLIQVFVFTCYLYCCECCFLLHSSFLWSTDAEKIYLKFKKQIDSAVEEEELSKQVKALVEEIDIKQEAGKSIFNRICAIFCPYEVWYISYTTP